MARSVSTREIVHPLAPLEAPAQWLTGASVSVAVGLVVGFAAAWLLRRKGMHWSWAAAALAVSVLLRSALAGLAPALLTASICAATRGRRRHREDIQAGADLAEVAARRRTPADLVRMVAGAVALRRRRRGTADRWFRAGEMIVGRDGCGGLVSVPCGGPHGGTHTLLVGATGSGKTVTQTWMVVRSIERGMGAIVVDPKGDTDMRDAVASAARAAGREFVEWTPRGPSIYNPFAHGSETEIADKLLAGERFTEPHYLRQAQRLLGHVVRALRAADVEVDLPMIVEQLDPASLELLVRSLPADTGRATEAYLDSLTTRQLAEIAGVRDRLAILAESDVGSWLASRGARSRRFDLLEAIEARDVVYFDLDADSRPLLTQMLGAAIVQDLQTAVASLQGRAIATVVVIDEFSTLAADHVVRLFGRARSAGLSVILSTQELSDLRLHGREGLLEQVMGNLTVVLSHRQVVPGSAELIASLAGTRGSWRISRLSDGRMTRTRLREGALSPDAVMGLGVGCVAAIVLTDDRDVRLARVLALPGALKAPTPAVSGRPEPARSPGSNHST